MANNEHNPRAACPTDEDGRRDPASCNGGCPGCGGNAQPPEDGLKGLRFAAAAVVAFLLPLVLAVVGSLLGGDGNGRVVGAVVGLLIGLIVAVVAGKLLGRTATDSDANPYRVDTSEPIETHGDSIPHKRHEDV